MKMQGARKGNISIRTKRFPHLFSKRGRPFSNHSSARVFFSRNLCSTLKGNRKNAKSLFCSHSIQFTHNNIPAIHSKSLKGPQNSQRTIVLLHWIATQHKRTSLLKNPQRSPNIKILFSLENKKHFFSIAIINQQRIKKK